MRSTAPHPLIRYRWTVLVLALLAFAFAAVILVLYKGVAGFPLAATVAPAAIAFVWLNGAFWWLELRYPHIEVAPGQFSSRHEQASQAGQAFTTTFFVGYGLAALLITLACLNVAASA
ncbi:hypothetical protein [Methylibium rhizosphaerae]|uniref:hypothetical protein n=1 Tax=Methylibium rhizosphaerae TaxID=2570323 RepID=UPI0015E2B632|nr:hypothetical protein [Methylibium rhizosphaerae]